jgi:chemotaxis protein MotB
MITLLLALFILLYSMSQTDVARFKAAAESVRAALGVPQQRVVILPPSGGATPRPIGKGPRPLEGSPPPRPTSNVNQFLEAIQHQGLQQNLHILEANAGVVIRLQDDVLFETGRAALRTDALPVISRVAFLLRQLRGYSVRIEGHTDDQPISTPEFPSNWELSTARALSVARALIADGVDPRVLSAAGYGEFHPIATNATPEGRARNRRVEVVISRVVEQVRQP